MKHIMTALLTLMVTGLISGSALAKGAPLLGNLPASGHQLCGKSIQLQLAKDTDGRMLLGLKNKQNNNLDLFISNVAFNVPNSYARFVPVRFDQLSKNMIETHDSELDVIWGAAYDDKNVLRYKLALGNYTYSCSAIEAWPNDKANHLYGEPADSDQSASENVMTAEKNAKPAKIVKPKG